jgi:hypothetical protein
MIKASKASKILKVLEDLKITSADNEKVILSDPSDDEVDAINNSPDKQALADKISKVIMDSSK